MARDAGTIDYLTDLSPHLWAIGIVFFGVGDLATTLVGLHLQRAVEVGVLASVAYEHYGLGAMVPLKAATLAFVYLVWRMVPEPHNIGAPLGIAVLGVLVTLWNSSVLVASFS